MMCQQPPWGQLTAVNVNTGDIAWRVPLGSFAELDALGVPKTGKELWTVKLGGAAQATPSTYLASDGRQYVVITSTGGGFFDTPLSDDSIVAFALPRR